MTQNMGWGVPPGPYGWTPPPPPKPGVIPLAPLKTSDLLSGSFSAVGRYWKPLFGTALTAYGSASLIVCAAVAIAYAALGDHLPAFFDPPQGGSPSWEDGLPLLIALACVWVVAMVVLLLASGVVYAACPVVLQDAILGAPATFRAVWARAWARVPAVLGTVFLTALIMLLPLGLFIASFVALTVVLLDAGTGPLVVPFLAFMGALPITPLAIWLWVKFSLAPSAAVFEGQGAFAAMKRSSRLIKGSWWRVFGITFLATTMAGVANMLFQQLVTALASIPGSTGTMDLGSSPSADQVLAAVGTTLVILMVGQFFGQIIVSTFPPLVTGLVYVDLRIRKENLAPALAQAAGVAPPPFSP